MKQTPEEKVFRSIKEIRKYYSKRDDKLSKEKNRYRKLGFQAASAALNGA